MSGLSTLVMKAYYVLSVPVSILFILNSRRIHPAYRMSLFKKYRLGFGMFFNTLRIPTGSSYKSHLAMALKILEIPPELPGDVVECGTWKGGSAANLSLVCKITGRKLLPNASYFAFTATFSSRRVWVARYTVPMPPRPSSRSIRHWPSFFVVSAASWTCRVVAPARSVGTTAVRQPHEWFGERRGVCSHARQQQA